LQEVNHVTLKALAVPAAIEDINRLCTTKEVAAGQSQNTPGAGVEEDEEEGKREDGPHADIYNTYFASLRTNIYET
jgi:hypothetical protein